MEGGGWRATSTDDLTGGVWRGLGWSISFTHVLVDPKKSFHRAPELIPKVIAINRSALTPRCEPKKKVRKTVKS